jgi:hypothetical protein
MNHRDIKDKNLSQENNEIKMINEQSIPIKQMNIHRSCLKNRPNQQSDNGEIVRLSTGRVSFAHATLYDGKILVTSQSQIDSIEKKCRSDTFAKKAKEFQLAELTYFKDHARDKEPIDE